jgi:hypothetical protein
MPTAIYLYPLKTINSITLEQECLAAGIPVVHYGCSVDSANVRINTERVLTSPEQTTLGTVVTNHVPSVQPQTILGIAGGGTGLASYAVGDLLYASSSTGQMALARLPAGIQGQRLEMTSTVPTWGGAHGCSVNRNGDQAVNNSPTAVQFNFESRDTNGYHDLVTNNTRLTVPPGLAGDYLFLMYMQWENNTSNHRYLRASVNAFALPEQVIVPVSNDTLGRLSLAIAVNLAVGDYVEMIVTQTSTTVPLNLTAAIAHLWKL